MKNKAKFIPFLLAVPLLFMANSPVPGPDYYEYSDYEISDLVFEEADENGKYPFSTHIKNTGNNYISLANSYLGGGHRFTNEYYASGLCIAPHSEGTYVSRDNVVNKFSLDEVKFVCYAYESHGFAQYSDIEFVSKKMENDWTKYTFHANDYQTPEQTRYGKLITVSIKGEKMCIFQIVGNDDVGIVNNITSIITKEKDVLLRGIDIRSSEDGLFSGTLTIMVSGDTRLNQLISKIKSIKGVKDVIR